MPITPSPWVFDPATGAVVSRAGHPHEPANVVGFVATGPTDTALANGKLIQAAPDLLQAAVAGLIVVTAQRDYLLLTTFRIEADGPVRESMNPEEAAEVEALEEVMRALSEAIAKAEVGQ